MSTITAEFHFNFRLHFCSFYCLCLFVCLSLRLCVCVRGVGGGGGLCLSVSFSLSLLITFIAFSCNCCIFLLFSVFFSEPEKRVILGDLILWWLWALHFICAPILCQTYHFTSGLFTAKAQKACAVQTVQLGAIRQKFFIHNSSTCAKKKTARWQTAGPQAAFSCEVQHTGVQAEVSSEFWTVVRQAWAKEKSKDCCAENWALLLGDCAKCKTTVLKVKP